MALKIWWPRTFHHGFENMVPVICIASFPGLFKNSTFQTSLGMRLVMSSTSMSRHSTQAISLVPRPRPAFHFFSILQVKKSWVGPGNEATQAT